MDNLIDLSEFALDELINTCMQQPYYKGLVSCYTSFTRKEVGEYVLGQLRQKYAQDVSHAFMSGRNGNIIVRFNNESVLTISCNTNKARGNKYHEIIADMRLILEDRQLLQRLKITYNNDFVSNETDEIEDIGIEEFINIIREDLCEKF